MDDQRWQKLIAALAEYFECGPEDITELIVGVEFRGSGTLNFRTTYSGIPWHYNGLLDRMRDDIADGKKE